MSAVTRRQFAALATEDEHVAAVAHVLGIEDEPGHDYCRKCGCADAIPGVGLGVAADHICLPPLPVRKARRRR